MDLAGSSHRTVEVRKRGWMRRLFAFIGPAYLVSVGYMDPGNWATDIEGGARFGYALIWVLLMSNLMAVLLQTLSARLGIVTGHDLAQGCRREYPRPFAFVLWIFVEIAIAATDLAEALGTILGLNLLFGLPLIYGCVVTAFDTFLLLAIQRLGIRKMEAFIVMLVATIGGCFLIEVFLAEPSWGGIARGFVPRMPPGSLYIAIGIIGATVMPHNLYLHSSLVQSRAVSNTYTGKAQACWYNFVDSAVALNAAFFVNAAILVMAAADFNARGIQVTEIQQAHSLLDTIFGGAVAPAAFAIALIAAGQSSTLTGTLAGQIVMEGFVNFRMRPWLRRLVTRAVALIPAVIVIAMFGDRGTYRLLILSQVILGLQLPFAIIPLIHFTSDRKKMREFVNPRWVKLLAWIVAVIVVVLNLKLVYDEVKAWILGEPLWHAFLLIPIVLGVLAALAYVTFRPLFHPGHEWEEGAPVEGERVAARITPRKYKNIGVALEHADGDAEVLSAALGLAKQHGATLTLIHVVDTPGSMVYGSESGSLHGSQDEAYLEQVAREVEERDQPVEFMLRFGRPSREIVKAAEESGFDLLVLGSHGHRGLADIIYGETVAGVRHGVPIPVLVVRVPTRRTEPAQRDTS